MIHTANNTKLQDALRNGITLQELFNTYKVRSKRHKKYDNLILFKYSTIDAPPWLEIIPRESRGIILDESDNWKCVSRPYDKFFNYQEVWADPIDWTNAICLEKLDGSLMVLYFYDNQWMVASSGTPDASGNVNDMDFTFSELFWKVWSELGYVLPNNTDMCYMFELMTPYNRIVVSHEKNRLVLHGARVISSGEEVYPEKAANPEWEVVRSYSLNSIKAILDAAKNLKGIETEGFVIVDSNWNRIKVKSPDYVAMSQLKEGFNLRRILEIVRGNEGSEVLAYFPEYTKMYNEVENKYSNLIKNLQEAWDINQHHKSQKEFALAIKDEPMSGILFSLRAGKIDSIKHGLATIHIDRIIDHLKLKEIAINNE